jgi:hypothetical protein
MLSPMQTADVETRPEEGPPPPLEALRLALGDGPAIRAKIDRLLRTAHTLVDHDEIARRLERLRERGYLSRDPTVWQLLFGSVDMFRFALIPSSHIRNGLEGRRFWLHQLARVLEDPASMLDPTGLLSERDTIIGHLMQVQHFNATYDLELLEMFDDGLARLEDELVLLLEGDHPRAATVRATVDDPSYHARLLEWTRQYRELGPDADLDPEPYGPEDFQRAEATFGTLRGYLGYCVALPQDPTVLLDRALALRELPAA